jgi:coenzyme F420-reducing hydrogenase delta subunit
VVDPSLCVSCGICVGACPTATPFRRASELISGIDLPDGTVADLRMKIEKTCMEFSGNNRILMFGCEHGVSMSGLNEKNVRKVALRCIGQLPTSFIDYVLSKKLCDGVVLTGCSDNGCHARFGNRWTDARVARERDPQLRNRVPRERLRVLWAGRTGRGKLDALLRRFADDLAALPADKPPVQKASDREKRMELSDG